MEFVPKSTLEFFEYLIWKLRLRKSVLGSVEAVLYCLFSPTLDFTFNRAKDVRNM